MTDHTPTTGPPPLVACRTACPVGTDGGELAALVAAGDHLNAYRAARRNNPFAGVCGLICSAPCERACIRSGLDAPVGVRDLERFVTNLYGAASFSPPETTNPVRRSAKELRGSPRICVIGAGAAGLSAAHDLALMGARITVLEEQGRAGGFLTDELPDAAAREVLDREIDAVLQLGVELRCGVSVPHGASPDYLREQGFQAFVVAAGESSPDVLQHLSVSDAVAASSSNNIADAVASGQRAARDVHALLTGRRLEDAVTWGLLPLPPSERLPQQRDLSVPPEASLQMTTDEGESVSLPLCPNSAAEQARRCLSCSIRRGPSGARSGCSPLTGNEQVFTLEHCRERGLALRDRSGLLKLEYEVDALDAGPAQSP